MEELINTILRLARDMHGIKVFPPLTIVDIRAALTQDALNSGRLPTVNECMIMIQGFDEDEDVQMTYFERTFPETLIELSSLWQLK